MQLIRRSEWGSRYSLKGYGMGKVSRVIIHHYYRPDVPASYSKAQEIGVLRGVEKYHADQGWGGGTGYQYNIAGSGRIYEGRGLWRTGAHTVNQNSKSIGICFMIDGDPKEPTAAAWRACRELIAWLQTQGALTTNGYSLYGHTDFASKSCPGRATYPLLNLRLKQGEIGPHYLQKGDSGSVVREWQQFLAEWRKMVGGDPIAVDGDFGNLTHNETERFQRWAKIDIDGIVGPDTTKAAKAINFIKPAPTPVPQPEKEAYYDMLLYTRRQDAIDYASCSTYVLTTNAKAVVSVDPETALGAVKRGEKVIYVGAGAVKEAFGPDQPLGQVVSAGNKLGVNGANAKETLDLLLKL